MKDFINGQLLVLVIEEKREIYDQITSALSVGNYATCCCTNTENALAIVKETPPDLIIAATNLNGESAMELCERIKQHPGMETVPVMFLSSGQIPDIIRRHDPLGGTYYIRKPFDSNVLLELVDNALQTPVLTSG